VDWTTPTIPSFVVDSTSRFHYFKTRTDTHTDTQTHNTTERPTYATVTVAPKSVCSSILQRVLNAGACVVIDMRKFDYGLTRLPHVDVFIGLT